jgi:hypothetical protein
VTTPGGPISLPPDFCGGRAIFAVHATSATGEQGDGQLEVNCQIPNPGGQAPPETSEGRQGQRPRDRLQQARHRENLS